MAFRSSYFERVGIFVPENAPAPTREEIADRLAASHTDYSWFYRPETLGSQFSTAMTAAQREAADKAWEGELRARLEGPVIGFEPQPKRAGRRPVR